MKKTKIVALWAINGVGLGHTSRASLIANALEKRGFTIKFIVEHSNQVDYLKIRKHTQEILVSPRPWKAIGKKKLTLEKNIKQFLSNIDVFIGDMASIPEREFIHHLLPINVTPFFIVKWMSKNRGNETIKRLSNYTEAELIVILPEKFFEQLTNIKFRLHNDMYRRINFIEGFIFQPVLKKSNRVASKTNIAFCCGSGGVHSKNGLKELHSVIKGLARIKAYFGSSIIVHAWVGYNDLLKEKIKSYKEFKSINGFGNSINPNWHKYDLIIGRYGYNTLLEIMNTKASFITGNFETNNELNIKQIQKFKKFGIIILPNLSSNTIYNVVKKELAKSGPIEKVIEGRKKMFKSGIDQFVNIIESK